MIIGLVSAREIMEGLVMPIFIEWEVEDMIGMVIAFILDDYNKAYFNRCVL